MKERTQRFNELIKKNLGNIILKEIELPEGVLTTITRVETASNLFTSKIYVSAMPENKSGRVLADLNANIYRLQQKLNHSMRMRPIPKIIFKMEKQTKEADRIERLLEDLKNQGKKD